MAVGANQRPRKVAMLVAQRIMRDVARSNAKPGDLLPPERVMLEQYEIGRGTLREALRLLEFQGAIALKPGPGGGPVLLSPDASHLASSLLLFMQLHGAPYRTVVEVRHALEPITARMATERNDPETMDRLELSIKQMREGLDDQNLFLEANKDFHDIIAWGSGNAMLGFFNESILGIMDGTAIGIDYPTPRRKAILDAHVGIFDAMRSKDVDQAEILSRQHIDAYVTYAEKKFPDVLDRLILWDQAIQG
ncbi:FadR/GntR family transcriptional regulator [Nocardioides sediminis]|uniref:FadR/GntR family transcriptional regulator n=1 Tax=Nocardioides sediminis TaxID=433648 RepID=UPI0019026F1C|nr:FCD domain-containing protein [Nocardioides sediminis]